MVPGGAACEQHPLNLCTHCVLQQTTIRARAWQFTHRASSMVLLI